MRINYHRKLWGEIIAGNYEEKLSQEIMRRNYHRKLWGEIITGNYEENYHRKLWGEIITGNYQLVYIITRKIWELYGYCRIQKLSLSAKVWTVASPSLLEGNRLKTDKNIFLDDFFINFVRLKLGLSCPNIDYF